MSEDANDFLMGGGGPPSISFKDPATKGQWFGGKVVKTPAKSDVTQEKTPAGVERVFANGDPMMQVAISLQAVAPSADDDGVRRLFVRSAMRKDLKEAVEAAKATGVYKDGELYVMWYDDVPATVKGNNDRKLFKFAYKAPEPANDLLMGASPFTQPAAAPAPVAASILRAPVVTATEPASLVSVPNTTAAPVPQMTPAQYAAPLANIPQVPAGFDPQQWASATPEQRAGILALMGPPSSMPY